MKPVATLPNGITERFPFYIGTVMVTDYSLPTGGQTWVCHTSADLQNAFNASSPGDVILLDAGATYSGNFTCPMKPNPNGAWIYVETAGFTAKHAEATRVQPTDAMDMAKIVTPNTAPAIITPSGMNHWRFTGIEVTLSSPWCYFLIAWPNWPPVAPLADSIIIDRCYVHASGTQEVQQGIQISASNFAVIESYVDDIHKAGFDSSGIGSNVSPGPIKITNNYISASTENVILGGGGGGWGGNVPSDIEIRRNHLFKPLSWQPLSIYTGPAPVGSMVVKNLLEFKSAQRVLVDRNILENIWPAGQLGYAIVLTVRSSQSGDVAVVEDVTIANNELINVMSGFNTLAKDDQCGTSSYPNCHNNGTADRWNIHNNLATFSDPTLPIYKSVNPPIVARNCAINFASGIDRANNMLGMPQDILFQHNTFVANANASPAWFAAFVGDPTPTPPIVKAPHLTENIWLLDNVFAGTVSGDNGYTGEKGLGIYFPDPPMPPYDRFAGNLMLETTPPSTGWPTGCVSTPTVTFKNPPTDYTLVSPLPVTSDGAIAGVDVANLPSSGTDTPATPTPPSGLGSSTPPAQITLSWTAQPTGSYKVYRGTVSGKETFLATVTTNSYVDTAVAAGNTYYYYITTLDPTTGLESKPSQEISVTI